MDFGAATYFTRMRGTLIAHFQRYHNTLCEAMYKILHILYCGIARSRIETPLKS